MKLTRITKPLRSVQVRVTLAGELNGALELRINGSRVAGVDSEHSDAYYYTRVLVQCNRSESFCRQ